MAAFFFSYWYLMTPELISLAYLCRHTLIEPLDWVRDPEKDIQGEAIEDLHVEGALPYFLSAKAMRLAPNFTPTPFASATDGDLDVMLFLVCAITDPGCRCHMGCHATCLNPLRVLSCSPAMDVSDALASHVLTGCCSQGPRKRILRQRSKAFQAVLALIPSCPLWNTSSVKATQYKYVFSSNADSVTVSSINSGSP
jgi:hypothetical protein